MGRGDKTGDSILYTGSTHGVHDHHDRGYEPEDPETLLVENARQKNAVEETDEFGDDPGGSQKECASDDGIFQIFRGEITAKLFCRTIKMHTRTPSHSLFIIYGKFLQICLLHPICVRKKAKASDEEKIGARPRTLTGTGQNDIIKQDLGT